MCGVFFFFFISFFFLVLHLNVSRLSVCSSCESVSSEHLGLLSLHSSCRTPPDCLLFQQMPLCPLQKDEEPAKGELPKQWKEELNAAKEASDEGAIPLEDYMVMKIFFLSFSLQLLPSRTVCVLCQVSVAFPYCLLCPCCVFSVLLRLRLPPPALFSLKSVTPRIVFSVSFHP